jgi:hypothetical protein
MLDAISNGSAALENTIEGQTRCDMWPRAHQQVSSGKQEVGSGWKEDA